MRPKILTGVGAFILIVLLIIGMQPGEFQVERSTHVAAPPEVVYGMVNDFHRWEAWSPWAKLDPTMKTTYGGPPAGVGSTYAWAGTGKVGEGKMQIIESRPGEKVGIRLEFIKPMAAVNQTEFAFKPDAGGTKVSWSMAGHHNFMGKAFALVMNIDSLVGKDFEKGLAAMKSASESEAKRRAEEAARPASATTVPAGGAENLPSQ
jgi:carbon monoxide dehydrogenase subunit G